MLKKFTFLKMANFKLNLKVKILVFNSFLKKVEFYELIFIQSLKFNNFIFI